MNTKKMQEIGFYYVPEVSNGNIIFGSNSKYFETKEIHPKDMERIFTKLYPNHFTPSYNKRIAFAANMYKGTEKSFWYITSDIRGSYRGYRCKNTYENTDVGNIFASASTLDEAIDKFVIVYKEWIK